ncbi:hypothetical protein M8C21_027833 [Ambrosia artemisiifolia]|uniref:Uncharacterized protein n=1 Tax=Ambrosia artemisiifolia TaxID=4212 RepID=A0AAD5GP04_AMBAR|nr:hypothetical protein M8C21_027833 [Ambrosia artemisiifolia]
MVDSWFFAFLRHRFGVVCLQPLLQLVVSGGAIVDNDTERKRKMVPDLVHTGDEDISKDISSKDISRLEEKHHQQITPGAGYYLLADGDLVSILASFSKAPIGCISFLKQMTFTPYAPLYFFTDGCIVRCSRGYKS